MTALTLLRRARCEIAVAAAVAVAVPVGGLLWPTAGDPVRPPLRLEYPTTAAPDTPTTVPSDDLAPTSAVGPVGCATADPVNFPCPVQPPLPEVTR